MPVIDLPLPAIEEVIADHNGTRRSLDALRMHAQLAADGPMTLAELRRRAWHLTDLQAGRAVVAGIRSGLIANDLDNTTIALLWVGDIDPDIVLRASREAAAA